MTEARTPASLEDGRNDDARRGDVRLGAWMAAAQTGDQSAYGALLRECVGVIEQVARRQGVPVDRIDDVVQETLLTVHRARQTYDPARSFTAWLRVIAERRAVDLMRKTGRHAVREVHAPLAYERHADESAANPRSFSALRRRIAWAKRWLTCRCGNARRCSYWSCRSAHWQKPPRRPAAAKAP